MKRKTKTTFYLNKIKFRRMDNLITSSENLVEQEGKNEQLLQESIEEITESENKIEKSD